MYALFEDAGKFLAGRVLSETESSSQIELDSGRRVKAKSANVLLKFAAPSPQELMSQAQALSGEIDVNLVWEVAPEEDFGFEAVARDYFGSQAGVAQQAATLLCLFDAPHYFHRRGKGRFRKAPAEILQQALAAIDKKKRIQAQIEAWADELAQGQAPQPIRDQLYKILFKPDKNAPEYKAVVEAARRTQRAPLDLLKAAGAIDSPYQFHWRRFLFEFFPQGTHFAPLPVPVLTEELPRAGVRAFSVDDSSTTEIDDALSVQGLGTEVITLGVHIAAPALALAPGSALDQVARTRLSTVYMPGHKITMLPDDVVQAYTLQEGRECPALSLYARFDAATLALLGTETRVERVFIECNLRHDRLDGVITEASLLGQAGADYPFAAELAFGFRLARHLKAARETVRGKPEVFNRPDYNFRLLDVAGTEPGGQETVDISVRQRGAPLDLIVAEAMILANSTWGGWLHELGVPAIYRSQASLAPGIKVRMGTKALPHAGMGVAQYAWSTSPLRRYVDLLNQWQIIACVRHGRTAALAAPFKPKDAALFAVISSFDAAYTAYNAFQSNMERYWTLKYLQQQGLDTLEASVLKEGLVRAEALPLFCKAVGAEPLPRGARVSIRIHAADLLTLEVHASVVARLDGEAPPSTPDTAAAEDEALEESLQAEAAPLALAIDVQDADAMGDAPPSATAAH